MDILSHNVTSKIGRKEMEKIDKYKRAEIDT